MRALTFGAIITVVVSGVVLAQEGPQITWKQEMFDRTSHEEDVTDVLRSLLKQNGNQAIFRPGVQGKVTFEFFDMSMKAAFTKLTEENNLAYEADPINNTVTIFPRKSADNKQTFITLKFADPKDVAAAAHRFGLEARINYDQASNTLSVRGTAEQVSQVKEMVDRMDSAAKDRVEFSSSQAKAQGSVIDVQSQAQAQAQRAQMAKLKDQLISEILSRDVKVVPLKYANVGESTTMVEGKETKVPGIESSLRTLLDLPDDSDAKAAGDAKSIPIQFLSSLGVGRDTMGGIDGELLALAQQARPQIATDQRTNSVIVRGSPKIISEIERIIEQLDKPVQMVDLEILVVSAAAGTTEKLGVGLGFRKNTTADNSLSSAVATSSGVQSGLNRLVSTNQSSVTSTSTSTTVTGATSQSSFVDPVTLLTASLPGMGAASAAASFVFHASSHDILAEIAANQTNSKSQTIASPHVVTLNNTPAVVDNRGTRYVSVGSGANATNTLKEIKYGLLLSVVPSVVPNSALDGGEPLIRLAMETTNSTITSETVDSLTQYSTPQNRLKTQIVIPNGATFVMGGAFNNTRAEGENGIPVLKDLPILGRLFKDTSSANTNDETIFVITPKIVTQDDMLRQDVGPREFKRQQQQQLHADQKSLTKDSYLLNLKTAATIREFE